jgi:hypothetical protein
VHDCPPSSDPRVPSLASKTVIIVTPKDSDERPRQPPLLGLLHSGGSARSGLK